MYIVSDLGYHFSNIFNNWWLLITLMTGFWSVLFLNPALSNSGRQREAELAFFGGWFWLGFGLIGFIAGRIFEYFF